MKRFLLSVALLVLPFSVYSQDKPPEPLPPPPVADAPAPSPENDPDVPEIAEWEIKRRGLMVQEVGTVHAGPTDVIADALAVPPDDSHKWFLTVVTLDNCKACDRAKADFNKPAPELVSWVNVDDPAKSTFHYQVRRYEDPTQADWFKNIGKKLERGGFPAFVIQPPKNGSFGPNKTIVKILHDYKGPEDLTVRMREAIVTYVNTVKAKGEVRPGENQTRSESLLPLVNRGGFKQQYSQATPRNPIGVDPPFSIPDRKVDPFQPNGPGDWPPSAPTPLTVDQIRLLCPGAGPEFIVMQISKKATDPNLVKLEWEIQAAKDKPAVVPMTPTTPTPEVVVKPSPETPIGLGGLISLVLAGNTPALLGMLLMWFRQSQSVPGKTPLLPQDEFNLLLGLTNGLGRDDLDNLVAVLKKRIPAIVPTSLGAVPVASTR